MSASITSHSAHHVNVCETHGSILSQCRCAAADKEVRPQACPGSTKCPGARLHSFVKDEVGALKDMGTARVLCAALRVARGEVWSFVVDKGWDAKRSFGDDIALLHSELSEALEAHRDGMMTTKFEHGRGDGKYLSESAVDAEGNMGKPVGMPSELADVFVRLLDTCARYDVDLGEEYMRKMQYNATRSYRHGGKKL